MSDRTGYCTLLMIEKSRDTACLHFEVLKWVTDRAFHYPLRLPQDLPLAKENLLLIFIIYPFSALYSMMVPTSSPSSVVCYSNDGVVSLQLGPLQINPSLRPRRATIMTLSTPSPVNKGLKRTVIGDGLPVRTPIVSATESISGL